MTVSLYGEVRCVWHCQVLYQHLLHRQALSGFTSQMGKLGTDPGVTPSPRPPSPVWCSKTNLQPMQKKKREKKKAIYTDAGLLATGAQRAFHYWPQTTASCNRHPLLSPKISYIISMAVPVVPVPPPSSFHPLTHLPPTSPSTPDSFLLGAALCLF